MDSRNVEKRSNLERDLAILLDNYLLLTTMENSNLTKEIVNIMYGPKEEVNG